MPIRLRLALIYTAVLSLGLLGFIIWFYSSVSGHLMQETDDSLRSSAAVTAQRYMENSGENVPSKFIIPKIDTFKLPGLHIQILNQTGNILYCSENLVGQHLPPDTKALRLAQSGSPAFYTATEDGERIRVLDTPVVDSSGRIVKIIQVGKSLHHIDTTRKTMGRLASIGLLTFLAITGIISFSVTSRALKPVSTLTSTARAIAGSQEFNRRIREIPGRDELSNLTAAFNEMLASLEDAYRSQRRFLADASHQLRSPLTSMRNNISFLQKSSAGDDPDKREALSDIDHEARRMSILVSQLLYLARTDAGAELTIAEVELSELVSEEFDSFKSLAGPRRLTLNSPGGLKLLGDADSLRQGFRALLENAIRYTCDSGVIEVKLLRVDKEIVLSVSDDGIGIKPEEQSRIFDRFFRGAEARKTAPDGTGLGLSIVKRVADIHHARVKVVSNPGKGSTFELTFAA